MMIASLVMMIRTSIIIYLGHVADDNDDKEPDSLKTKIKILFPRLLQQQTDPSKKCIQTG